MGRLIYLTHPEVIVDPDVPVPSWGLSVRGVERSLAFGTAALLDEVTSVWSSTEVKAVQTARLVAGGRPWSVLTRDDLHENDRSSTGYLPGPEFETLADRFFAHPEQSARGWERAVDAQRRIVAAVTALLVDERSGAGDVLVVGHGGVGTLLLCHLSGRAISRELDQPGPGGFVFTTTSGLHPQTGWRPVEAFA